MPDHIHTRVQKAATPGDLARNLILENISIAAFQEDAGDFIARQWFPTIGEPEQAFTYYTIDMASIGQNKAQPRAPGTKAEEGGWNASSTPAKTQQFGYREKLTEEMIATSAIDAEEVATKSVAEVMAISDEVRVASIAWKTGVWGRDVTGVASAPSGVQAIYWNASTGVPISNVLAEHPIGKLASRRKYNTLILGADVVAPLLTNAQVLARVVNGQRPGMSAQATLDDIANLFKVDRVLVAGAVYNTANETTTNAGTAQVNTPAFIMSSKSAWLGYVNPSPSKLQTTAGLRFTWQGLTGNSEGFRNWRYWDQDIRSFWIEGAVDDTFQIVSPKCGVFFSGIVQ